MIRRLILALWLCVLSSGAWAAVAIDATGTESLTAGGVTNLTGLAGGGYKGLTIGSPANGAILCMLQFDANVSALTVTWDSGGSNLALSRIGTGITNASGFRAELFGAVAPASGNKLLAASWTTAAQAAIACISVSGANQTGGTTTFAHVNTNTGTGTTLTVTVTSTTSDMVGASFVTSGTITSWAVPATSIYIDTSPTNMSVAAARQVGAVSTSVTINVGGASPSHAIVAAEIVAATASNPCPLTLLTTGVGC